jgi:hypothetical protein
MILFFFFWTQLLLIPMILWLLKGVSCLRRLGWADNLGGLNSREDYYLIRRRRSLFK